MGWSHVSVALAAALAVLAGCAAPPEAEAPQEFVYDETLEATATTGVIRGIVVDPAVVPVAGATVTIQSLERTATVNEAGAFGFDGVEPGTHFLRVEKAGWTTAQTSVEVEAGVDDPPVVRILLDRDAATAPYATPYQFHGFMRCSLSYIALCGVAPEQTGDTFTGTFELDGAPTWISMESVWEGTQPTGDQMNLNLGRTPSGPSTTAATAQGPSPLLITVNETVIQESGIGTEGDLVGRMFSWEMEGTGIDDHTGLCIPVVLTTYCQGPGVALEQEFDLFVHAFYHYAPPEDWRFTDDPDVPQPLQ